MQTILISLPYAMSARNILRSRIFPILKDQCRLVIVTPLADDPSFKKEFSGPNVVLEPLVKDYSLTFRVLRHVLDRAEAFHFTTTKNIATLGILRDSLRMEHPWLYRQRYLVGLLFSNPSLLSWLREAQIAIGSSAYYTGLIERHKPSLVWLTHTLALEEFPIAFSARLRGVAVIGLIHSWDLLTAKTGLRSVTNIHCGRMMPLIFNKIIAWNELQKKELKDFYLYKDEDIFVSGIPQFDCYGRKLPLEREAWMERLGLGPAKKTIAFFVGSDFMHRRQKEVLELLAKALGEGFFGQNVQILLRGHPGSKQAYLEEITQKNKNIRLNIPGLAFSALRFEGGWNASDEESLELAHMLAYSDVIINVASTISLDGAFFDKPTVCVGFDGKENLPYHQSIRMLYDFTHYRYVTDTGGVRVAKSPEDLLSHIKNYLENTRLDAQGRETIRRKICWKTDAMAGERIARFVLSCVGDAPIHKSSQQQALHERTTA